MAIAKIVDAPKTDRGSFSTITTNTDLSQRATLEETIVNLATHFGIAKIYKQKSARGGYFYSVELFGFQSASNVILELSRKIKNLTPHSSGTPNSAPCIFNSNVMRKTK
ncbi:MAG: hypothetical protein WC009_09980 [Methylotenera sp.]